MHGRRQQHTGGGTGGLRSRECHCTVLACWKAKFKSGDNTNTYTRRRLHESGRQHGRHGPVLRCSYVALQQTLYRYVSITTNGWGLASWQGERTERTECNERVVRWMKKPYSVASRYGAWLLLTLRLHYRSQSHLLHLLCCQMMDVKGMEGGGECIALFPPLGKSSCTSFQLDNDVKRTEVIRYTMSESGRAIS